jgi:hypothetical protein
MNPFACFNITVCHDVTDIFFLRNVSHASFAPKDCDGKKCEFQKFGELGKVQYKNCKIFLLHFSLRE